MASPVLTVGQNQAMGAIWQQIWALIQQHGPDALPFIESAIDASPLPPIVKMILKGIAATLVGSLHPPAPVAPNGGVS